MNRFLVTLLLLILLLSMAVACADQEPPATDTIEAPDTAAGAGTESTTPAPSTPPVTPMGQEQAPEATAEAVEPPVFDNLHVPSPVWEDQIIYFLMTDRFNDGDPGNNDQGADEYDPADGRKYSGGDFQGIIDQLDYIQGLGATAIWITPPVANMWWDPLVPFGGYHGYWAENFKEIDAHLGDLATYQALSDALHDRGMYLIQDVVTNHVGNFFTYSSENGVNLYRISDPTANVRFNTEAVPVTKPSQAPFDLNDVTDLEQREAAIYHWSPVISDFSNDEQLTNYQLSDLDDLNTGNPLVREALRDSFGYWIAQVGVDGFRVDTVRHVEHDFWNDFMYSQDRAVPGMKAVAQANGKADFFAFGEAFIGSDPYSDSGDRAVVTYMGTADKPEMDGVLNFPLYFTINRVFAEGAPTDFLSYRLETFVDSGIYPDPGKTPTFIDNHDVSRFMSIGGRGGLKQASLFQMTIPGIPVIYYGSEQGFLEQRPAMFAAGFGSGGEDHFDTDSDLYRHYQTVTALRKSDPIFTRGQITVVADTETGPGVFAYRSDLDGESILVIFNTSDRPVLMSGLETGLPEGSVMELLLGLVSQDGVVLGPDGRLTMELAGREGLVLKASDETVDVAATEASITIASRFEGQLLENPFEVSGLASQGNTQVRLVINDNLAAALETTAGPDGAWTVTVPVDNFLPGQSTNTMFAYAPELKVTSETVFFDVLVSETSAQVVVYDELGDDVGPLGLYKLPTDETFGRQMDIEATAVLAYGSNLVVGVKPAEITTVWDPANGFDHVLYHVFIDLPGQSGLTELSRLNASAPEGFEWNYMAFIEGWNSRLYSTKGATADAYGETVTPAPYIAVDPTSGWIIFLITASALGNPDTLEGTQVYITTWDWNGVDREYRPLRAVEAQWNFGGGDGSQDPLIIDDTDFIRVALDTRIEKDDPAGDDNGPGGVYAPPTEPAYNGQMDLLGASLVETDLGLRLDLRMAEVSHAGGAPNGFDQALIHAFIDIPGKDGQMDLPGLNSLAPAGLAWDYAIRLSGWTNQLFPAEGGTAAEFGPELAAPTLTVDEAANTISLLLSPDAVSGIGLAESEDIKIYITTWDWDEQTQTPRALAAESGPNTFGGGDGDQDPLIMDDLLLGMAGQYVSPFPQAPKVEVTFLVTVPDNTPAGDDLFMIGPFNQWAAANAAYQFQLNDDGLYSLVLTLDAGTMMEYRIGRGTLANTELIDPDDRFANHQLTVPEDQEAITVEIEIDGWWDL